MAIDLESIIKKTMDMAEASQKARGIDNFGSTGFKYQQERAYNDAERDKKWNRINEEQKQKDLLSTNQLNREKDVTLHSMQYGPGGSTDRGYATQSNVAGIQAGAHRYGADQSLAGQQSQSSAHRYGADQQLAGQQMQYGPGGSIDRQDALKYQKLTPEAQRAEHASNIAGRLAATGASSEDVKSMYNTLSSPPPGIDFSAMRPGVQDTTLSNQSNKQQKPPIVNTSNVLGDTVKKVMPGSQFVGPMATVKSLVNMTSAGIDQIPGTSPAPLRYPIPNQIPGTSPAPLRYPIPNQIPGTSPAPANGLESQAIEAARRKKAEEQMRGIEQENRNM